MATIDIIAFILLGAGILGILIILLRRFPTIAAIDSTAMVSPLEERKSSLIEERLKRKLRGWSSGAGRFSQPMVKKLQALWTVAHQKLVALEHEYRVRSLPAFLNRHQRQKLNQEIQALLNQADVFLTDGEYHAAEEKALQAIRFEPRSIPAFEMLGRIYLQNKQYGYAKEVYKYLLKLGGEKDAVYEHLGQADLAAGHLPPAAGELKEAIAINKNIWTYHLELAQVYRATEEWAKAWRQIEEAARLEPNNPKILDEYIEISIGAGKKQFAESALQRIAESNPGNSKISEWRTRIAAMNGTAVPRAADISSDSL